MSHVKIPEIILIFSFVHINELIRWDENFRDLAILIFFTIFYISREIYSLDNF